MDKITIQKGKSTGKRLFRFIATPASVATYLISSCEESQHAQITSAKGPAGSTPWLVSPRGAERAEEHIGAVSAG